MAGGEEVDRRGVGTLVDKGLLGVASKEPGPARS